MTRRITPATPSRRITWFTLLGLVLVPLAAGAVLLAGLWDPTARLHHVTAAVVNEDQPVTIKEQTVPLGRRLAAGLVDGGDTNYTWVLTDAADARSGVADGTYAAVVTIPKAFSAAATSTAGGAASARQATIDVATTDRSRALDNALTAVITSTARQVFNRTMTTTYLDNLYVGFSGVHDALAKSADGARALRDGSSGLADGTQKVADGAAGLADGVTKLDSGAASLATGLATLSSGVARSAAGGSKLATGADQVSGGATTLATSAARLAGATAVAGRKAASTDTGIRSVAMDLGTLGAALAACEQDHTGCGPALGQALAADPALAKAFAGPPSPAELLTLATDAATTDAYLNGAAKSPGLVAGTRALASGAGKLADGAKGVATGANALASGLGKLSSGAASAGSGAAQLAGGVSQASTGAAQLASGAGKLTGGAGQVRDGAGKLADGLAAAADQVPAYSAADRTKLSKVAAEPLAAGSQSLQLGGVPVVALLAAVALWLGGLATWLLIAPVPAGALASTRSSSWLAVRNALPGAGIGVVEGVAVGLLMLTVLHLDAGRAAAFLGLAALTGVTCALVQQGLAGLLGGVGRFISVLFAAGALAAGVVSTAPGWLAGAVGMTPVGTALSTLRDGAAGAGMAGGVVALVLWATLGLLLSLAATARARSVRVGRARSRPVAQLSAPPA